jgi:hypothetical protein
MVNGEWWLQRAQHALSTSISGGDDDLVHAFAFDGAKSEAPTVVTTLVNWDMDAERNKTVSLRCQVGRVAVYMLTPAMSDGEGERRSFPRQVSQERR